MTLTFTHDLDILYPLPILFVHHNTKFGVHTVKRSGDMIFFIVTFFLVSGKITFSNMVTLTFNLELHTQLRYGPYGQTDRQTDGQKAIHKSPPCMSTGGLNKIID